MHVHAHVHVDHHFVQYACICMYVNQSKANESTQGRQLISKKKNLNCPERDMYTTWFIAYTVATCTCIYTTDWYTMYFTVSWSPLPSPLSSLSSCQMPVWTLCCACCPTSPVTPATSSSQRPCETSCLPFRAPHCVPWPSSSSQKRNGMCYSWLTGHMS